MNLWEWLAKKHGKTLSQFLNERMKTLKKTCFTCSKTKTKPYFIVYRHPYFDVPIKVCTLTDQPCNKVYYCPEHSEETN
jgi:hypothetical protein